MCGVQTDVLPPAFCNAGLVPEVRIFPGHSVWGLRGDCVPHLPRWEHMPPDLVEFIRTVCEQHQVDFEAQGVKLSDLARWCQGEGVHEELPPPWPGELCEDGALNCYTDGS
eukprot:11847020-Alexandrium_andersonii.AAC.1